MQDIPYFPIFHQTVYSSIKDFQRRSLVSWSSKMVFTALRIVGKSLK